MHRHWVDRVPLPAAPSIRTVAALWLALTFALASPALVVAQSGVSTHPVAGMVPIRIETEFGNIDAYLDSARAPVTVTNFLRYIDAKLYDSASFFRSVTMGNQPNDSVKIQVGTDQFSIMIGDQPELDFGGKRNRDGQGFAAFGQVTSGWDVLNRIHAHTANGQTMTSPVVVLRIVRPKSGKSASRS